MVFGLESTSFHQDQTPKKETSVDCILNLLERLCN